MMSGRFQQKMQPKPQRSFYTIHLKDKHKPFVFHISGKSTLVCLKSLHMTEQLVECIRGYYAYHQSWPNTELDTGTVLQINNPDESKQLPPSQWATVPKLWIVSWTEKELDTFAMNHLLDLIEIKDDGKTHLYSFQYDLDDLQSYFERLLKP